VLQVGEERTRLETGEANTGKSATRERGRVACLAGSGRSGGMLGEIRLLPGGVLGEIRPLPGGERLRQSSSCSDGQQVDELWRQGYLGDMWKSMFEEPTWCCVLDAGEFFWCRRLRSCLSCVKRKR
jgi:hypothetical protein